jgi:hypothetical protein
MGCVRPKLADVPIGHWYCSACVDCKVCKAEGAVDRIGPEGVGVGEGVGGCVGLVKGAGGDVGSNEGLRMEVEEALSCPAPLPLPHRSLWGTSLGVCCECEALQTARKEAEVQYSVTLSPLLLCILSTLSKRFVIYEI